MKRLNQIERRKLVCHLVDSMRKHDSWAGETHIQKCVMFMQKLMDVPTGYQFVLYLHGPFSFDLRSELALMRARLQLDIESNPSYGPSFTLGVRGKLATKSPTGYEDAIDVIAREVSVKDTRALERLSTAFFLMGEHPARSARQTAEEINRLKPHISVEQALQAIAEANDLRQRVAERRV